MAAARVLGVVFIAHGVLVVLLFSFVLIEWTLRCWVVGIEVNRWWLRLRSMLRDVVAADDYLRSIRWGTMWTLV